MSDILDMLRDFKNFNGKIERDLHNAASRIKLPDEIDLYNFFGTWGGRTECRLYEGNMTAYSIDDYVRFYDDAINIRYYIGKAKYYALRFNGRGVFLVSERRYNELKAQNIRE